MGKGILESAVNLACYLQISKDQPNEGQTNSSQVGVLIRQKDKGKCEQKTCEWFGQRGACP